MKTYDVLARCKTPDCKGILRFGAITADSLDALTTRLREFGAQEAMCSICQRTAVYRYADYVASPLDERAGDHRERSHSSTC